MTFTEYLVAETDAEITGHGYCHLCRSHVDTPHAHHVPDDGETVARLIDVVRPHRKETLTR